MASGVLRKVGTSTAREPSLGKGQAQECPGVLMETSVLQKGSPSGWWAALLPGAGRVLLAPQGANQLHSEKTEHSPPYSDLAWFPLSDSLMKALGVGCHGYAGFNI